MARFESALVILRHLQKGPAGKGELIRAVQEITPDAYDEANQEAQDSSFERDMKNVRQRLGADVICDRSSNLYYLNDPGPFFRLALSDDALSGLAFLLDAFDFDGTISDVVRPFLASVQNLLTAEQAQRLERFGSTLHLKLQNLDETKIAPIVWQKVNHAVSNRHVLRFDYLAPRHEKPEPRTHTVEPYDPVRYHRGHFELRAFCRHWSNPHGWEKSDAGWIRYRLDRIQPDTLEVLPEILHLSQRQKRLIAVCYRISPDLARGGVSQHFEEMEVGQPDKNGWVEVTGKTADLFEAERVFLAYGQHCVVLGPPALVTRMKQAASEMAQFYEDLSNL